MSGADSETAWQSLEGRAFVEACRWWLWCDAGFVREQSPPNTLDRHMVRRICNMYQVSRTIPLEMMPDAEGRQRRNGEIRQVPVPGDPRAVLFGCKIAAFAKQEHDGLHKTAQELSKVIKTIAKDNGGRQPISAATKVLWFLRPRGWTMFDRWAALGVLGRHANNLKCMEDFYKTLEDRGFDACLQSLREELQGSPFGAQLAERVIDKYLFLVGFSRKGAEQPSDADSELSGGIAASRYQDGFLQALPSELRAQITATAGKLNGFKALQGLCEPPPSLGDEA